MFDTVQDLKIIVLGLGNSMLRDDGAGPAVRRRLERSVLPPGVALETTNLCGMPLLDILTRCDTLIIVDGLQAGARPGEIHWMRAEDIANRDTTSSQHHMDILRMLEIGKALNQPVPADVRILAIGTREVNDFGEYFSPEVGAAIPKAARMIKNKIEEIIEEKVSITRAFKVNKR